MYKSQKNAEKNTQNPAEVNWMIFQSANTVPKSWRTETQHKELQQQWLGLGGAWLVSAVVNAKLVV
jgi:hypothetical protein